MRKIESSWIGNLVSALIAATVAFPRIALPQFNSQQKPQDSMLLSNWMKQLNDSLPVSMLSIPGTHNSASYACKFFQAPFNSQCQSWSIYDQLRAGIRFLDIRINAGKTLYTAHGMVQFQPLSQQINQISNFMKENPQEFIIIAFDIQNSKEDPSQQILDLLKGQLDAIFTKNIPTVRQMRGKIWVFASKLIKFSGSPTFSLPGGGAHIENTPVLYQQDMYWVSEDDKHGLTTAQKVNEVLFTVYNVQYKPQRMKLNYLSASNVGLFSHPYPYQLAMNEKGPNNALYKSLSPPGDAQPGITIMDFPGQELISRIVACNFK